MPAQNLQTSVNPTAFNPALAWAKENLNAGVDPEEVVSALVGQGWTELTARQVLDAALSVPVAPLPAPGPAPTRVQATPRVVGYATARQTDNYKAAAANAHLRNMRNGGIVLAIGLVITVGTFSMASGSGGTYFLAWRPILFGGIRFISGFFGWIGSR